MRLDIAMIAGQTQRTAVAALASLYCYYFSEDMLAMDQEKSHHCDTYRGIIMCGVEGGMGGRVAGMFGASPLNFGVELGQQSTFSTTTDSSPWQFVTAQAEGHRRISKC
jgi:hypothetical protein